MNSRAVCKTAYSLLWRWFCWIYKRVNIGLFFVMIVTLWKVGQDQISENCSSPLISKLCFQLFTYTGEIPLPPSTGTRSPTNSSDSAGSSGKMGNSHGGSKTVLSDEDLNFIACNTALSRQEVDERYAHFLERHPDGKITKKEFRHMMQVRKTCQESLNIGKPPKSFEWKRARISSVSRIFLWGTQNAIPFQVCYPSTDTDKLEKHIFRMYDANGDGFIDFREFMLVLYVLSSGTPEENLKQIFRIFDINNDKSISR